jgi:hypothetical protein
MGMLLKAELSTEAFLTANETALFLRISPVTLSRWRIEGAGPPFRKFGRRVLYARPELLAWTNAQKRSSTSDSPDRCNERKGNEPWEKIRHPS